MAIRSVIVNNILVDLVEKGDFPKEQLVDWLKLEIGMSDEELSELPILQKEGLI